MDKKLQTNTTLNKPITHINNNGCPVTQKLYAEKMQREAKVT